MSEHEERAIEVSGRAGSAGEVGERAATERAGTERGSLAIEAAILIPAIAALFSLVVIIGQLETASGSVQEAARVGARTVTLNYVASESDKQLNQVAGTAVVQSLAQSGVSCHRLTVQAGRTSLQTGNIPLQMVRVDIKCTVQVNDLFVTGVPGEMEFDQSFTSAIDYYRPQ